MLRNNGTYNLNLSRLSKSQEKKTLIGIRPNLNDANINLHNKDVSAVQVNNSNNEQNVEVSIAVVKAKKLEPHQQIEPQQIEQPIPKKILSYQKARSNLLQKR